MKILITGSEGFVGRHLVEALRRDPIGIWQEIVGIDLKSPMDAALTPGTDARDFFATDATTFDLVFHCAALVGGRHTIQYRPLELATRDLELDALLFSWAMRTHPGRVVYFSSSAAYPMEYQLLKRSPRALYESMLPTMGLRAKVDILDYGYGEPDMSYGWVKLTGERLAGWYQDEGGKVTVVRPFSGYGADQDLDYPFPSFIARAAERADPFVVWGNGVARRDWIHIDDIVAATLTLVHENISGPVNLGTGRGISFDTLAALCMSIAGYDAPIAHVLDAPVGAEFRVADATNLRTFYEPRITIEEGIARALAEATHSG